MYEVSVTARFFAAHQLRLLDGTLEPLHEHNWTVTATFRGPRLDRADLLLDFEDARRRLEHAVARLHDHNLNHLPAFAGCNPSAEAVARYLAEHLNADLPADVHLACVEVQETPGCAARYYPPAARPHGRPPQTTAGRSRDPQRD